MSLSAEESERIRQDQERVNADQIHRSAQEHRDWPAMTDFEPGRVGAGLIEQPQARRVQPPIWFRPISEIIAAPTHGRWLLPGIVEERTITLVAGKRGSFKSFLVLHWALTLAVRGVPVFIVSAEGDGLGRRVEAWLKTSAPDTKPDSLPLYVYEHRVDFSDPRFLKAVRDGISASGIVPKLLVIDTFSKNSGALDENSNSEVKAFISGLDTELRSPLDLAIILVAHTGHGDQGRVRGASALEADTDAVLLLRREGKKRVVEVVRERFKDAPEMPPLVCRAEVVDLGRVDDEDQHVTSIVMREADDEIRKTVTRKEPSGKAQQAILGALRNRQAESKSPRIWTMEDMRKIGRGLGQTKDTARSAVEGLINNRWLVGENDQWQLADGAE